MIQISNKNGSLQKEKKEKKNPSNTNSTIQLQTLDWFLRQNRILRDLQ